MNLVSVTEAANLIGKTPSMIYLLAKRGLITRYRITSTDIKGPSYLVDSEEIVKYYENKTPRDYRTFLQGVVVVDGEEYVTLREASRRLKQTETRVRYIASKYDIRSTDVANPAGGETLHRFFCLTELKEFNETVNKIIELRESLKNIKKRQ